MEPSSTYFVGVVRCAWRVELVINDIEEEVDVLLLQLESILADRRQLMWHVPVLCLVEGLWAHAAETK